MSDLDYPRMLYRKGGEDEIFGLKCETRTVEDAEEEKFFVKGEGWARTPFEAHGVDAPKPDSIEDAAPDDDEKLGLLNEIEDIRDQLKASETALAAERDRAAKADEDLKAEIAAHEQTRKELKETADLLADATKPAEQPKKLTVPTKAAG